MHASTWQLPATWQPFIRRINIYAHPLQYVHGRRPPAPEPEKTADLSISLVDPGAVDGGADGVRDADAALGGDGGGVPRVEPAHPARGALEARARRLLVGGALRRRRQAPLAALGRGFSELRGRPEATTTRAAVQGEGGEDREARPRPLSYMSSCPFADLVVAVLFAVAVLLHAAVLACTPRSMHQGLHGWNKSSSMLRDGFGVKYSGFLHIRPCGFCRGD